MQQSVTECLTNLESSSGGVLQIEILQSLAHEIARSKGFYKTIDEATVSHESGLNFVSSTQLMNATSELAECNEWLRKGNPESDHLPGVSGAEEEVADCIIRLLDFCEFRGWNIGKTILSKMQYNIGREHMNGGKKF